jgi:hypothetical protein
VRSSPKFGTFELAPTTARRRNATLAPNAGEHSDRARGAEHEK